MTDSPEPDRLTSAEIGKDTVQSTLEAGATAVGEVATIITAAVRDVATAIGGFATEVFEIRESARKASGENPSEPTPPAPSATDVDPAEDA